MLAYILRRLLLMIPTILGIMAVSFAIVQFVPGGPVERAIAQLQGADQSSAAQFGGGGGQIGAGTAQAGGDISSRYRGSQGLDPKFIKELEKQYGFDKPALERFWILVRDYSTFNFGRSYYRDVPVLELIREKLPVSISLGMWMTVISYAISIPLGIRKAVRDGSRFDTVTSALVIFGYAIPSFLFAVLLVVLFCGGSFWQIFPLRGLTSMKGLTERRVLYGHVFRNAMLIVIAGFPGAFIGAFFAGSLLIEQVFSLDGLGYLSYDSLIQRDYPVVLANLYIFALIGLVVNLISDLTYTWIDPRIDFETREV
jgi:microcin C transport system permease protein